MHDLKNLIKEATCFKNPEKPTVIDLILTNKPKRFQHSCTYETGISDFHKMTITVIKVIFKKQKPKIIFYHNYKNFDQKSFKEYLKLSFEFRFKGFSKCLFNIFKKFCTPQKKYVGAKQASFMNKELKNAIMVRSKLRNKFLKSRSEEDLKVYNKKRIKCVKLLKKKKKLLFKFEYQTRCRQQKIVENCKNSLKNHDSKL